MGDARYHSKTTVDPDTSMLAALQLDPDKVTDVKHAILVMLRAAPRCAFEVAIAYGRVGPVIGWPDIQPYSVHRRMSELKKAQLIYDTGERRPTPDGRTAAVMAVTPGVTIPPKEYK